MHEDAEQHPRSEIADVQPRKNVGREKQGDEKSPRTPDQIEHRVRDELLRKFSLKCNGQAGRMWIWRVNLTHSKQSVITRRPLPLLDILLPMQAGWGPPRQAEPASDPCNDVDIQERSDTESTIHSACPANESGARYRG